MMQIHLLLAALALSASYTCMYSISINNITTDRSPITAGTVTPLSYCQKALQTSGTYYTGEHNRYAKLFWMNSKGIPTLLNAD